MKTIVMNFCTSFRFGKAACAVGFTSVVIWSLFTSPNPTNLCAAPPAVIKTPLQRAQDAIRSDRFDEAFLLAYPNDVRFELLKEISLAEKGKDTRRQQQLYTAYLENLPLWNASTYGDLKEWGDVAGKFLSSQKIAGEVPTPEQLREQQAKVIYDQILAISYDHKDTESASRLAEELVDKYPKTLYCRIGVVGAAGLDQRHDLASTLEQYLKQLDARGTTKRTHLAILKIIADESARPNGSSKRALAAYREILQSGVHECEKAHSLFAIAQLVAAPKTPPAIDEAKKLYQRYWTAYPKSLAANRARFSYVQTYIESGELAEALALIEKFRLEDPQWSLAATAYLLIAGEYRARSDDAQKLLILHRAMDQYPGTSAAGVAWAMIANRERDFGRPQEEYDALKLATAPMTAVIDHPSLDRDIMRNAMERLEQLYINRKEWHQALELGLRPRPSSAGCGNEIFAQRFAQCKDINECVQHLSEDDPLRKEGLAFLLIYGRRQFPQALK